MDKREARQCARTQKKLLTDSERLSSAAKVFAQLEQLSAFKEATHILMYHSLPDELSTIDFIAKWQSEKIIYLPRVNGETLDILRYDSTLLQMGSFMIKEPTGDELVNVKDIELIVVPGMAFDKHGNRVGRGKGFYDRLLSQSDAIKIGVAYDCQLIDKIDTESFDQPVDMVITPSGTYFRKAEAVK